jgi:hypothetical protein
MEIPPLQYPSFPFIPLIPKQALKIWYLNISTLRGMVKLRQKTSRQSSPEGIQCPSVVGRVVTLEGDDQALSLEETKIWAPFGFLTFAFLLGMRNL